MAMAVGFLVMIFIHEMGHYLAAKQLGLPVSAPPLLHGRGHSHAHLPKSAKDEPHRYRGPVLERLVHRLHSGTRSGSQGLIRSQPAFMLNLFNLIPLAPMDGGRISMVINRHLWVLGAASGLGRVQLGLQLDDCARGLAGWLAGVPRRHHAQTAGPGQSAILPARAACTPGVHRSLSGTGSVSRVGILLPRSAGQFPGQSGAVSASPLIANRLSGRCRQ